MFVFVCVWEWMDEEVIELTQNMEVIPVGSDGMPTRKEDYRVEDNNSNKHGDDTDEDEDSGSMSAAARRSEKQHLR